MSAQILVEELCLRQTSVQSNRTFGATERRNLCAAMHAKPHLREQATNDCFFSKKLCFFFVLIKMKKKPSQINSKRDKFKQNSRRCN